jgi:hypothetical protein
MLSEAIARCSGVSFWTKQGTAQPLSPRNQCPTTRHPAGEKQKGQPVGQPIELMAERQGFEFCRKLLKNNGFSEFPAQKVVAKVVAALGGVSCVTPP